MILFLDFDGVMHPGTGRMQDRFCRAPLLWEILRACHEVEVVFSSSWRELYQCCQMTEFVTRGGGEDLVRRFIGATPDTRAARALFGFCGLEAPDSDFMCRELEIEVWRRTDGFKVGALGRPWLAIDDVEEWFAEGSKNLHLVNGRTGLTPNDVEQIVARFITYREGN